MSSYLMDDLLHPSGGTGRAIFRAFRRSAFDGFRLNRLLLNRAKRRSNKMLIKRSALNAICMIIFLIGK
jgi:hypothetical protein